MDDSIPTINGWADAGTGGGRSKGARGICTNMLKRGRSLLLPFQRRRPGFKIGLEGKAFRLTASGSWTIREAAIIDEELSKLNVPVPPTPDFVGIMDISGIEQLDTAGAWLLNRTAIRWEEGGLKTSFSGSKEDFTILLDEVRKSEKAGRPKEDISGAFSRLLTDMVRAIEGIGRDLTLLVGFLGAFVTSFLKLLVSPGRFRHISFVHHMDHAGFRAIPIVALICFLIGAVILQQGVVQLKTFGAEPFAVNMLGVLALREVGVLLTAIMVAGRSGSAFTAEIGSMKMREEIDAMRTLGIDPMETLVLPRVLALMVVVPILAFIGALSCLLGGAIMAKIYLGMDMLSYIDRLQEILTMRHLLAGLLKAPFAALIIGLVGCVEGLKVAGSAESLGVHVTSSVVKAIFLVIIFDAVFAMFLAAIEF